VTPASIRKWVAFGSGLGFRSRDRTAPNRYMMAAVRYVPAGARVAGAVYDRGLSASGGGRVGTDYAAFARKLGLAHVQRR